MNNMQTRERRRDGARELGDRAVDTEIARVLAVALAIGSDGGLREKLRGLAGAAADGAFAVSQPDQDVWLTVEADRVVARKTEAERRRPG